MWPDVEFFETQPRTCRCRPSLSCARSCGRSRPSLRVRGRPASGSRRRQRWNACGSVWRNLVGKIRQLRCSSRCQINGRAVCDRDGAYGEVFIRRLRSMGIRDRPTSPRSRWQNGYVERLIGSIRRECLDQRRSSRAVQLAGTILCRPGPGRAAPPICSDLIYDRHSPQQACCATPAQNQNCRLCAVSVF